MQHHWYPEGYIDPMTPPKTPVWTNTFKSYHNLPLAPTGSNSPVTSGSSLQSARVPVTSHSLGFAPCSAVAHSQSPAVNYQRALNAVSPQVGPQGKGIHSSVPYNASVPQRLPRADSLRRPPTASSRSTNTGELAIFEPPPWDGVSEFINGSTYFKVDIRYPSILS